MILQRKMSVDLSEKTLRKKIECVPKMQYIIYRISCTACARFKKKKILFRDCSQQHNDHPSIGTLYYWCQILRQTHLITSNNSKITKHPKRMEKNENKSLMWPSNDGKTLMNGKFFYNVIENDNDVVALYLIIFF